MADTPPNEIKDEVPDEKTGDASFIEKIASAAQAPASKTVHAAKTGFHLLGVRVTSPFRNYNPTTVRVRFDLNDTENADPTRRAQSDVALLWRSRDNRKGRQSIAIRRESLVPPPPRSSTPTSTPDADDDDNHSLFAHGLHFTSSAGHIASNIRRMFTTCPYWDMAWWVGFWYTFGSIIWVTNGLLAWLPVAYPDSKLPGEDTYGTGLTAFAGVVAFQFGATIAYLEAVNEGCWHGSLMRRLIDGTDGVDDKALLDRKIQAAVERVRHPRHPREGMGDGKVVDLEGGGARRRSSIFRAWGASPDPKAESDEGVVYDLLPFRWFPTWKNFREHHVHEVGFLACATQLTGATLFIITGIVALPGILDSLKPWQENVAYWVPQMVASVGFILGSVFFILETQERWWKPAPKVLGWWIGVWALAGSIGFELCASLAPAKYHNTKIEYQVELASLWGSACFLVNGLLQLYEAVNKNPIEELLDEPGEMKSWQAHPL